MAVKRIIKVLKLRLLKPAGTMGWDELGRVLREVRYRIFRLANLAVSEACLNIHLWRTGRLEDTGICHVHAGHKARG